MPPLSALVGSLSSCHLRRATGHRGLQFGALRLPLLCPPLVDNRLRTAGASVDALEVFPTAGGFGTRATRPLALGETFLLVPREVILDEAAALASPVFGAVARDAYESMGMFVLGVSDGVTASG